MAISSTSLMIRLDPASKTCVARAAELSQMRVRDTGPSVVVAQAEREVQAAEKQLIALTPSEQLAFWRALQEPVVLTQGQEDLGALMHGE